MKLQQVIKGHGGKCAYCDQTPVAKFTYSTRLALFAWACSEEHAKAAYNN